MLTSLFVMLKWILLLMTLCIFLLSITQLSCKKHRRDSLVLRKYIHYLFHLFYFIWTESTARSNDKPHETQFRCKEIEKRTALSISLSCILFIRLFMGKKTRKLIANFHRTSTNFSMDFLYLCVLSN